MTPALSLTLTGEQHTELRKHLFPGDGLEAVAFIACGRAAGRERHRLVARYLHVIPYSRCIRERDRVQWSAEDIESLIEQAEIDGLSLVKVHSHPQGLPEFSRMDDTSDAELLPTIRSWVERDIPHGSAIMLPDGSMFGRCLWRGEAFIDVELINVVGHDLLFWWRHRIDDPAPAFAASQDQAFGEGTTRSLNRLRIGVIGVSGTGSPVIEQFIRLAVGHVVAVDDDFIEDRNLNRIFFATVAHAEQKTPKVAALDEHVQRKGLSTRITPIAKEIGDPEALRAISECDIIIGCVDTASARFIMNLAATHYNLAYFDLGILLDAEQDGAGRGRIKDILGTVHYLIPGRSSLLSRGAFTMAEVAAEELHKRDPAAAARQIQDKYIKGLQIRRPAVISVNMFAAALAVNDFLARLHPYGKRNNAQIASIEFSLGELRLTADEELDDCTAMRSSVGMGDRAPWLGLPHLGTS